MKISSPGRTMMLPSALTGNVSEALPTPVELGHQVEAVNAGSGTYTLTGAIDGGSSLDVVAGSSVILHNVGSSGWRTSANKSSGGGGSGLLLKATVTLTDAQIKALPTTAVEVVAAPGDGKIIEVIRIVISSVIAGSYTNAGTGAGLVFKLQTDQAYILNIGSTNDLANIFVGTGTGDVMSVVPYREWVPNYGDRPITYGSGDVGSALTLSGFGEGAGDFTGGDPANTLKVSVLYTIEDV